MPLPVLGSHHMYVYDTVSNANKQKKRPKLETRGSSQFTM